RLHEHPPPLVRIWAGFIEQQERPALRLEENWIPARISLGRRFDPVGDFYRRTPLFPFESRKPDSNISILFPGPAEPGGHQTILRFHDGRSVALWKRSLFENKFGFHNRTTASARGDTSPSHERLHCEANQRQRQSQFERFLIQDHLWIVRDPVNLRNG